MKKTLARSLALSALFAALIFLSTYLLKVPVLQGYIHAGDGMIFVAAGLLPGLWGPAAAAVGAALADLAGGFGIWAPFTAVIKFFMALCLRSDGEKILTKRNVAAVYPASFVNLAGYYLAEALIYGNWISPLYSAAWNLIQFAAGIVLFYLAASGLDRAKMKSVLFEEREDS